MATDQDVIKILTEQIQPIIKQQVTTSFKEGVREGELNAACTIYMVHKRCNLSISPQLLGILNRIVQDNGGVGVEEESNERFNKFAN